MTAGAERERPAEREGLRAREGPEVKEGLEEAAGAAEREGPKARERPAAKEGPRAAAEITNLKATAEIKANGTPWQAHEACRVQSPYSRGYYLSSVFLIL